MTHRIVTALKWACGAAALAFTVMFFTPLVMGGPGAHQAPLLAFLLTPIIFVGTLILALVWSRLGLIAIVASLLYPAWYYAQRPPPQPEGTLMPLNIEEQVLVRSRHFDARVAVDAGTFPPIYRANLIEALRQTGLFSAVGPMEDASSVDLIATVTGSFYGDKTGHSFSLRWREHPERRVNVKVWHYASDGPFLYASRHRLQVGRLALEVVRQMDTLGPPGKTTLPAR